jgi:predicted ferric reductase
MFVSANSAAQFLLPSKDWSINYGIISLILMILFLLITFYTKIMGKLFKSTHKYLGLAFILAILHTFLITSDISRIHGLKIYMWILTILGLMIYSYFSIFKFDKKIKEINA